MSSLLKQDYPRTELIVVDDGSTDGSDIIAATFHVDFHRSAHFGRSHARNLGLCLSNGAIVMFAEADAYYQIDFISKCIDNFRDPTVGGVSVVVQPHALSKATRLGRLWHAVLEARQVDDSSFKRFVAHTAYVYRRKAVVEAGCFDERMDCGEDVDLGLRVAGLGFRMAIERRTVWYHYQPYSIGYLIRKRFWQGKSMWPFYIKQKRPPIYMAVALLVPLLSWLSYHLSGRSLLSGLYVLLGVTGLAFVIRLRSLNFHKSSRQRLILEWCVLDFSLLSFAELMGMVVGLPAALRCLLSSIRKHKEETGQSSDNSPRLRSDRRKTQCLPQPQWRFAQSFALDSRLRLRMIIPMIFPTRGDLLLDDGCGTGFVSYAVATRGASVVGVDLSRKNIRAAHIIARSASLRIRDNLHFVVGDAHHLPFASKRFDKVICSEVLQVLANENQAIEEIARVVKESGSVIVTTSNTVTPLPLAHWSYVVSRLLDRNPLEYLFREGHDPRSLAAAFEQNGVVISGVNYTLGTFGKIWVELVGLVHFLIRPSARQGGLSDLENLLFSRFGVIYRVVFIASAIPTWIDRLLPECHRRYILAVKCVKKRSRKDQNSRQA